MEKITTTQDISLLADGQLQGEEFARAVEAACQDPAGRQAWHTYHLIGDVLRASDLARGGDSQAFALRLRERLAAETPPAAIEIVAAQASVVRPAARFDSKTAANDGSFRWKVAAGVASVAAVAALGWNLAGGPAGPVPGPQLAALPAQPAGAVAVAAGNGTPVMIRDARLDEFLAAHRQLGGASALQMPAGFLRSATFEGGGR